jgi:hypothetical protein
MAIIMTIKRFMVQDPGQNVTIFYGRNLRMFLIRWSVRSSAGFSNLVQWLWARPELT